MTQKKSGKRSSPLSKKSIPLIRRWGLTAAIASFAGMHLTSCGTPSMAWIPPDWASILSPQKTTQAPAPAPSHTKQAARFSSCPQFFAEGLPPISPQTASTRELCYEAFAVLHSGKTRTPAYVAQRLNRKNLQLARNEKRTDKFFADARLPRAERAELSDYKGSGYSRGHMAPAADMHNGSAMAQSFSLANMVPQNAQQNSGPWASIEKDTRSYVMRAKGDVYVITGPVFSGTPQKIGSNQVQIPSHMFKLVYDPHTRRSWAHWQPNSAQAKNSAPISYEELVKRTQVHWLPALHDD